MLPEKSNFCILIDYNELRNFFEHLQGTYEMF